MILAFSQLADILLGSPAGIGPHLLGLLTSVTSEALQEDGVEVEGRHSPLKLLFYLITKAKTWKQLKCTLMDEWVKKM